MYYPEKHRSSIVEIVPDHEIDHVVLDHGMNVLDHELVLQVQTTGLDVFIDQEENNHHTTPPHLDKLLYLVIIYLAII